MDRLREQELYDEALIVITADHGNDPTMSSTDHSREYVPILMVGASVQPGVDVGTRSSFSDLGQTLAEALGVAPQWHDEPVWAGGVRADRARAWGWAPRVDLGSALDELRRGLQQ